MLEELSWNAPHAITSRAISDLVFRYIDPFLVEGILQKKKKKKKKNTESYF